MNIFPALQQREARLGLFVYCAAIGLAALALWSSLGPLANLIPPHFSLAVGAASLATGGVLIARCFGGLVYWDRRLANLTVGLDEELDGFKMDPVAGSSDADRGWNQLVRVSRRWQALAELERSLSARLAGSRDRSGPPLLDSLIDGVATVDSAGNITYANAPLAAICGAQSVAALLGQSLIQTITTNAESATKLRGAGPQSAVEWQISTPSGNRTLQGRFRPGRKCDGAAIAYVWTIRDVTQQRLADSMRDQFLATATHEFRTPLANIRAYAESLDVGDEMDAESRKRFYNIIQSESTRLSQLVDDLLDISRMQAGALSLDCHETELERLLEEVSAKVQGEIAAKHQEFRCELPPKLPPKLSLDKGKLSAALVNLLGNATKYTPDGGCVTFRVEISEHRLQFTISDSGFGIAPEDLPRVFDRFYRSNDDRIRELSGSGLGLALTREVARLHGGDVTVESQLNQGSSFCLSIPVETAVPI